MERYATGVKWREFGGCFVLVRESLVAVSSEGRREAWAGAGQVARLLASPTFNQPNKARAAILVHVLSDGVTGSWQIQVDGVVLLLSTVAVALLVALTTQMETAATPSSAAAIEALSVMSPFTSSTPCR